MAGLPWFPFYPADFLLGTIEWDSTPHGMALRGAYIWLLCIQWDKGWVSQEAFFLAVRDFEESDTLLLKQKFTLKDGRYYNERLATEREKTLNFHEKQRKNGALGGRPVKNPVVSFGLSQINPTANPNKTQTKPNHNHNHSHNQNHKNKKKDKEQECPNTRVEFEYFYQAYPKKQKKEKAWESWQKIMENGAAVPITQILEAVELWKKVPQWTKDKGQFIPMPATWLNNRGWEDKIEELQGDKYV
jgi:hypothetical protein